MRQARVTTRRRSRDRSRYEEMQPRRLEATKNVLYKTFFFVFSCLRGPLVRGELRRESTLPRRVSRRFGSRILHVLVEPVEPLREHVQQRLARRVAVGFVGQ